MRSSLVFILGLMLCTSTPLKAQDLPHIQNVDFSYGEDGFSSGEGFEMESGPDGTSFGFGDEGLADTQDDDEEEGEISELNQSEESERFSLEEEDVDDGNEEIAKSEDAGEETEIATAVEDEAPQAEETASQEDTANAGEEISQNDNSAASSDDDVDQYEDDEKVVLH